MTAILAHFDLGRGLLAMLISLTLYTVVQGVQNPPDIGMLEVGVEIVNVPSGLLVVGEDPTKSVQTRVSAPREMWPGLRPSSLHAIVDLSRATAGGEQFYPVAITLPDARIRVLEIIPPQVSVRLDENIERTVPVRPNRAGSVPFGYEAGEVQIDPTTVSITGPASLVRRVEAATVEIRLDGLTVPVDGRYRLSSVDAQGQPVATDGTSVRLSPAAVRVRVPVTQQLSYKTVGVQPVVAGVVQAGYAIEGVTSEPPAVTIVGSPQALAAVNFAQTERIDATDASATFARQVSVVVPEGVSLVQEGVARVTVRITALELSQALTTVPLPENLGPGLQLVSGLPNVQIVINRAPSSVRGIQASDVRATVNLAGLGPGTHQVEVEASAPAGITVQVVNPRVIAVAIEDISSSGIRSAASTATPPPPE